MTALKAKEVAQQLATAEQQMSANAAFKLERARLREAAEEARAHAHVLRTVLQRSRWPQVLPLPLTLPLALAPTPSPYPYPLALP